MSIFLLTGTQIHVKNPQLEIFYFFQKKLFPIYLQTNLNPLFKNSYYRGGRYRRKFFDKKFRDIGTFRVMGT